MSKRSRVFVTPRFRGGRFESHTVPVQVLAELTTYGELVAELAKHLRLRQDPRRKRLPKGFADSFQLGLSSIVAGCVEITLERISPPASLFPPTHDAFDEARDLLERVLEAGETKSELPVGFPRELIPRFNRFGMSLRDDESVELVRPGRNQGPRYDRSARKHIVLQQEQDYEAEVDLSAELNGIVLARDQIVVLAGDAGLVEGKYPREKLESITHLLNHPVRVVGVGAYDGNDKLRRLVRVDDVNAVSEEDYDVSPLDQQFEDLRALAGGWFEPGTPPLDREGLEKFQRVLEGATAKLRITTPHVYPVPEGGVSAEWSLPEWEVSATASFGDMKLELFGTHLATDEHKEREVSLEDVERAEGALVELFEELQDEGSRD